MDMFWNWWQYLPHDITPYFFKRGNIEFRYYGLMYIVAFAVVYLLCMHRLSSEKHNISRHTINDFFTWVIIGVLLGGRLGYVLFYDLGYFLKHPLEIFLPVAIIDGGLKYIGIYGMSYHGGLLGVILATFLFSRKHKFKFSKFLDFFVPCVPLGYMFGRIGNFLNGELYGRVTEKLWGMYFPLDPTASLRHPSQLYEAFFEGIVLFLILWPMRKGKNFDGFMAAYYLLLYGTVRFAIEFFREPDAHLGFLLNTFTMGQILSLIMMLVGAFIIARRRNVKS